MSSKLEAVRKGEPYRRDDGTLMCVAEQHGTTLSYRPCKPVQQAAAPGGQGWGLIMFAVLVAAVGITWGGSYIAARQSDYDRLFTTIKRGMNQ